MVSKDEFQMLLVESDHTVDALSSYRTSHPVDVRILLIKSSTSAKPLTTVSSTSHLSLRESTTKMYTHLYIQEFTDE